MNIRRISLLLACASLAGCSAKRLGDASAGEATSLPLSANSSLELRYIPAGTFIIGSPETENGRKADEKEVAITLSRGYWMGTTEVTIAQWRAVMGTSIREQLTRLLEDDTPRDFGNTKQPLRAFMGFNRDTPDRYLTNESDSLPMYFVSWADAMSFCEKLTAMQKSRIPHGYRFTLPTEAQWEYACRAESPPPASLSDVAWFSANSRIDYTGKGLGNPPAGCRTVATKLPNAWGLRDMLGNLWEWCADRYGPYPDGAVTDPHGATAGIRRVNRGGSWGSGPNDERAANRAANPQDEASAYRGFRVALVR